MAASQVFAIPELLEIILLHLPIHEIIRAQGVCRLFQCIVETSSELQQACWYTPRNNSSKDKWKFNPVFTRLAVTFSTHDHTWKLRFQPPGSHANEEYTTGEMSLQKAIYETPGSWTNMLAFQPSARYMEVECWGDYSADETMYYFIETRNEEGLRMGDVMAILAECQNRQSRGVDRWAGVRHYDLCFKPVDPMAWHTEGLWEDPLTILKTLPDDVDFKVTVAQAWGSGDYPAFSLKRLKGTEQGLYEMIVHEMRWDGHTYGWNQGWRTARDRDLYQLDAVYKDGRYEAKMLRVRHHEGLYLEACEDVYKLLEGDS